MNTNQTFLVRRNLSSVVSPYTGKKALWVNEYNYPLVDVCSWLSDSFTFCYIRSKVKQVIKSKSKTACYFIETSDFKCIDGTDLKVTLNKSSRLSLPNPKLFDDVESFLIKLDEINETYNQLILHTDGNVYGLTN